MCYVQYRARYTEPATPGYQQLVLALRPRMHCLLLCLLLYALYCVTCLLCRARYAEETELLVIMDQRRPGSRPLNSTQGARVPKGTSLEGTPLVGAFGVTPLTNESVSNWGVSADPTTQWALVNLPPHLCKGCTLRLTHQVTQGYPG